MRLWQDTFPPEAFTAQRTYPGLITGHAVANEELCYSIVTFELFKLDRSQLTAYPTIQFLQYRIAANMPVVVHPAGQGLIQTRNDLWIPPRLIPPGQFTNLALKTGDTLGGQAKAPIAETGDSQGSFVRLHGRSPISPC